MPKVTPFLWYQTPLDEVVDYYRSIFPDFREIDIAELDRAAEGAPA